MDLIVFDLDGTLLNRESVISDYTRDTLQLLADHQIAYTVATGRTLHAARGLIRGHNFILPQIYKNGVLIWNPEQENFSRQHLLTEDELGTVLEAFARQRITPFIFTLERGNRHAAYHSPLQSEVEVRLAEELGSRRGLPLLSLSDLPQDAQITNISALGPRAAIAVVTELVAMEDHLVAYTGIGIQTQDVHWLDIHHSAGSKGDALAQLKQDLGVTRIICFGDSDNDLSMFEEADEAYAPDNAQPEVKAAATETVGHHDEDGIARFLRQRFQLG
ncbi:MAG: HAD-IIB family hydrolase [Halieaceae bacterium]|jgi:5-amino-6-(5-phospho-D-ribitylamino)uracil phosphatase|nr:HAD-IIB family hydrolase [Halieaceae bacterium]